VGHCLFDQKLQIFGDQTTKIGSFNGNARHPAAGRALGCHEEGESLANLQHPGVPHAGPIGHPGREQSLASKRLLKTARRDQLPRNVSFGRVGEPTTPTGYRERPVVREVLSVKLTNASR